MMLRRVPLSASQVRVKHAPSVASLRAAAAPAGLCAPAAAVPARSLVSTVLLTAETYEKKPVTELRALLRERALATHGRKAELITRLKQSDVQRAGSTLATAAPADPSLAKVSGRKASRAPKGKEAAERAAQEMPAAPLEPGSVSSPAAMPDGSLGKSSPPLSDTAPHKPTSPPGRPAQKAEPIGEHFNIKVPTEYTPPPVEQYIPLIKAYVDTADHDYSDSYRDAWHMAHAPRVHAVGGGAAAGQSVSHNATLPGDTEPELAPPGVLASVAQDMLPRPLHRSLQSGVEQLRASTDGVLRTVLAELQQSVPQSTPAQSVPPKARPSARRALNDDEKQGLLVLGAVVLTGFFLGGLGASGAADEAASPARGAATTEAAAAPVYEPPHYGHGSHIVGGATRKV
ncbi:hypothetical protein CBS9595_000464 [Malassezia furfur]|nr:hypothetical protein CBS9595_000464 [Malassezia furfur]